MIKFLKSLCFAGLALCAYGSAMAQDLNLIPASGRLAQPLATCTYTLSSGGQVFPAIGGAANLNITAPAGCAWNITGAPIWITFVGGASSGNGNGTVGYQVQANTGADRIATLNVAGISFTIEEEAISVSGLGFIGSMPHLAAEGGWNTTFTFVNKGAAAAIARTNLFAPDGTGLTLPVNLPQQPAISGPLLTSSIDQTITPNASFVMQANGPANVPYLEGSAQLAANGSVDGFAIFHFDPTEQEAVVPMETRNAPSYLLAFDNTNSVVTGVAIENVSTATATIPVIFRDDTGIPIGVTSITLNGSGHTSFVMSKQYAFTANVRGTMEFDTPPGGQISVLGIRYTPPGTLTTIPALAAVGTSGGSIAYLTSGAGWQTTFVLVNTGTSAAQATLKFFDDNGNPLSLPLSSPQPTGPPSTQASTITQTVAAGASLWVQSVGAVGSTLVTGSAQLTTTGNISGFVIFRFNTNGQEAVVPLETRNATGYLLAFDNTNGTATGVAVNNVSPLAVLIPVTLRDDTGALIGTGSGSLLLGANGHTSFDLGVRFPATLGIRGTLEFDTPSGAQIGVLGIRVPPPLTLTSLPALTK